MTRAEQLSKSLLRAAILHNEHAIEGVRFTAYEYHGQTTSRVLIQLKNDRGVIFSESDVECDVVTGIFRVWVDGVERGKPEMN